MWALTSFWYLCWCYDDMNGTVTHLAVHLARVPRSLVVFAKMSLRRAQCACEALEGILFVALGRFQAYKYDVYVVPVSSMRKRHTALWSFPLLRNKCFSSRQGWNSVQK